MLPTLCDRERTFQHHILIFFGSRGLSDHGSDNVTQLFDNSGISWQGVALSVVEHVSDIRVACVVQCQGATNVWVQ